MLIVLSQRRYQDKVLDYVQEIQIIRISRNRKLEMCLCEGINSASLR